jgi:hypothetical protein
MNNCRWDGCEGDAGIFASEVLDGGLGVAEEGGGVDER